MRYVPLPLPKVNFHESVNSAIGDKADFGKKFLGHIKWGYQKIRNGNNSCLSYTNWKLAIVKTKFIRIENVYLCFHNL